MQQSVQWIISVSLKYRVVKKKVSQSYKVNAYIFNSLGEKLALQLLATGKINTENKFHSCGSKQQQRSLIHRNFY